MFGPEEFRNPTMHFRLPRTSGKRFIYAYIRKNACSTFKAYFNQRPHWKYWVRRWLLRDPTATQGVAGNMAHYRHLPDSKNREAVYLFVYRDPIERVWSLYKNKFLEESGEGRVVSELERWTGRPASETTFADFMRYLEQPFDELNAHLAPQKSHLREVVYLAIQMDQLGQIMELLLGASRGHHFQQPYNRTKPETAGGHATASREDRLEQLRSVHRQQGLRAGDLMSEADWEFLRNKYRHDYAMIAAIEKTPN